MPSPSVSRPLLRWCIVVPTYNAAPAIADVVRRSLVHGRPVLVIDDGSTDDSGERAREAGATVVRLAVNGGKGGAIVVGLHEAQALGCQAIVVLDADGQHDPAEVPRLIEASADPRALVLGVRRLSTLGAPLLNRFANASAAWPISFFAGRLLSDALCGFRRYPIDATLRLAPARGRYEWECAVILALARTGTPVVQTPVGARYGPERFSFYRPWVDTLLTIRAVLGVGLLGRGASRFWARAGLALLGLSLLALVWVSAMVRLVTPTVSAAAEPPPTVDASARRRASSIHVVELSGSPYALGYRHARLAEDLLRSGDREMIAQMRLRLSSPLARWALLAAARLRFRHLTDDIPAARLREIAGETRGYRDPYASFLPTYARFVYYHAVYDLALSYEGSALVGCSAFAAGPGYTRDGHVIVGRNFDLEQDAFDRDKVVFLVREDGRLAYLSVAWAGFTGVVTGMNEAGLWVSVNGARGGRNDARGVPLGFVVRDILQRARTVEEAERIARSTPVMVPHLLLVATADELAVFERTPQRMRVRRARDAMPVANHYLDSSLATDPRNHRVLEKTSTRERFARLSELLEAGRGSVDVARAAAILRDHAAPGGAPLAAHDRRAIDADIATHSVIGDLTDRVLWIAEAPHTRGRYVPFDLPALLGRRPPRAIADVPARGDPLASGR